MRTITQIISWISLVVLVLPSLLFLAGTMELETVKKIMLLMTVIWFISASLWMGKER